MLLLAESNCAVVGDRTLVPSGDDRRFLLVSIFIIAGCSLIYELLISSLSTYLLGSGVVHYSVTIGLFLFFMGVGSWLAQHIHRRLIETFIWIELALGLVGGLCAVLLYTAYAWTEYYYPLMVLVIGMISILVGMEIPLLTRIFEPGSGIRQGISDVLACDYIGALLASLFFPFILLPYLGHLLTAFLIGFVNLLVALSVLYRFHAHCHNPRRLGLVSLLMTALLAVTAIGAPVFNGLLQRALYEDPVIHHEQSQYQKLVVTRRGGDTRLFLNGSLQFSSIDEYRYHEPLVHVPASRLRHLERALIIGGGDGLAARELLRYSEITEIVLVDLDPAVTHLGKSLPILRDLNRDSLHSERVKVFNSDAWQWLDSDGDLFDLIIIDLPDPDTVDIARLYTVEFYRKVLRRLSAVGVVITQASSPWVERRSFWSIVTTLETLFQEVRPLYSHVPSFGFWGYVMAANVPLQKLRDVPPATRYVDNENISRFFQIPKDLARPPELEANYLQTLHLMKYYAEDYKALQEGE